MNAYKESDNDLAISKGHQLLLAISYILASYIANLLKHGNTKFLVSACISIFIIAFFYYLAYLVRLLFKPGKRTLGMLLFIGTLFLFPALCYVVVYFILPLLHLQVHKPGVPFDWGQFFGNLIFAFFTLFLATMQYGIYYAKGLALKRNHELERTLLLKQQEEDKQMREITLSNMQSHFIKNNLHDIIARAEELGDYYIPTVMPHLTSVLDYSIDVMKHDVSKIAIERELSIVQHMADAIRYRCHSADAVVIKQIGQSTGHFIAPLILVTLAENACTHGEINETYPLVMELVFHSHSLSFTCTNKILQGESARNSWGSGLQLVQQSLLMLPDTNYTLEHNAQNGFFQIHLTITYLI